MKSAATSVAIAAGGSNTKRSGSYESERIKWSGLFWGLWRWRQIFGVERYLSGFCMHQISFRELIHSVDSWAGSWCEQFTPSSLTADLVPSLPSRVVWSMNRSRMNESSDSQTLHGVCQCQKIPPMPFFARIAKLWRIVAGWSTSQEIVLCCSSCCSSLCYFFIIVLLTSSILSVLSWWKFPPFLTACVNKANIIIYFSLCVYQREQSKMRMYNLFFWPCAPCP